MGEKKSNSDNEEDQDKRTIQDRINYQQIQQQIINDMNKTDWEHKQWEFY